MIEKTLLQNGIRVMTEHMPSVRSVAIGVWVNAGSVFESEANAGISHLIEHMLFKGTETRSASDIAAEADAIGANLNAFTAKECTCFHIKALDEDIEKAVGLLSDIVLRSTLDPEQMDRERGVVLEEIAMTEDSPEDIVFDRASEQLFMGTHADRVRDPRHERDRAAHGARRPRPLHGSTLHGGEYRDRRCGKL